MRGIWEVPLQQTLSLDDGTEDNLVLRLRLIEELLDLSRKEGSRK